SRQVLGGFSFALCPAAGYSLTMVDPNDDAAAPIPDDGEQHREAPSPREPIFNIPGVVTGLIAACVLIHAARFYILDIRQDLELLVRAAFIPIRYSGDFPFDVYAVTSPVTYSLLHGSILHLGINMIWLAAFGAPL